MLIGRWQPVMTPLQGAPSASVCARPALGTACGYSMRPGHRHQAGGQPVACGRNIPATPLALGVGTDVYDNRWLLAVCGCRVRQVQVKEVGRVGAHKAPCVRAMTRQDGGGSTAIGAVRRAKGSNLRRCRWVGEGSHPTKSVPLQVCKTYLAWHTPAHRIKVDALPCLGRCGATLRSVRHPHASLHPAALTHMRATTHTCSAPQGLSRRCEQLSVR